MDEYDPTDLPTFDAANEPEDAAALTDTATPQPASRVGSTRPDGATRPQMQAGFLVDSSDDEEASETVVTNGVDGAPAAEEDVPLDNVPTQDTTSAATSAQQSNGPTTAEPVNAFVSPAPPSLPSQPKPSIPQRMAHDKVGQLEDRISDEPRADPTAWMSLIQYYKEKDQLDNVRKTYDRYLEIYPTSASAWLDYLAFEQEQDDHGRIDAILGRALLKTPNVDLWLFYINVLRRRHPLISDNDGKNRATITSAFDFVLDNVGLDPEAGKLWREYIDFIKSGPGTISATSNHWQDQQKADLLRKAYHKAVTLPNDELMRLWKEYDTFENSFSRAAGRKFIAERSPHYMTARAARTQLDERIAGLDRRSLPKLPPLPGYSGDDEFGAQLDKWQAWIAWEKSDELVLRQDDDVEGYRKRVHYAYRQATMALRFYPNIWFEAAGWCAEQGTEHWRKEAETFLDAGIIANPESALLALRKADAVEASFKGKGESDEIVIGNGIKLDAVYETVHAALYALKKKYQAREEKILGALQAQHDSMPAEETIAQPAEDDDDEDRPARPKTKAQQHLDNISAIKAQTAHLQEILKRTISFVWVAKMRAFHRVQGQGKPKEAKKGLRGVFAEARPRGSLTSDVYIASALMEHHLYAEVAATKIFERGLKLFPIDELFILEYMKHLINKNDHTNAKAVFETSITRIEKTESLTLEQKREKCKPLYGYMYHFESNYGDLTAIHRLEKRMAETYPGEPEIVRFAERFKLPSFDATRMLLAISPIQTQPKMLMPLPLLEVQQPVQSIEDVRATPQPGQIVLGPHGPYVTSPKRPLEDSDNDTPRKFLRGDSPLKGAAGRRIAASGAANAAAAAATKNLMPGAPPAGPPPLPRAIAYLLSILPPASSYTATRFDAEKLVDLMRTIDLPDRVY